MFRRILKLSPWVILPLLMLGFAVQASILQAPSSGSWAPVPGTMAEATSGAASALLPDGRILITGGAGPSASAEFFNLDGSFSAAPAMAFPRQGHTAVTLQDGRVLVAGGTTAGPAVTDTAEIYDPATNAWTTTGLLMVPRSGHAATLLQDGRVLVAGGENSGGATASVEVFNPVSGTSSLTAGVLSSARVKHAAAALPDGRVLIVGGSDGTSSLASTDVFDPLTDFVAPGPALGAPRQGLSATTLLDGTVLIAGGSTSAPDGSSQDLASAEIFNSSIGTFTAAVSSLATARSEHLAILLPHNNSVLIVGGTSAGSPVASAELYRPWNGQFTATGSMASARASASGGSPLEGVLVVAGGSDGTNNLPSAEAYGFATLKTDKDDYAPGTIVTITGSGWQPGETVTLHFDEVPNLDSHPDLTAIADEAGNIINTQFSPDAYDENVRFYLTASGTLSQAQTTFTDSVTSVTISSPTSGAPAFLNSVPGTVAISFSYVTSSTGATSGTATVASGSNTKSLTPGTSSDSISVSVPGGTADGSYSAEVTVTNNTGGGASSKKDTKNNSVIVDTVAPNTSITAHPTDPSNSTSASFSFTGTDPAPSSGTLTFECDLDGVGFASCTSPKSYPGLLAGSHTFQVRAKDAAGNTDASPASFTWTIDTTGPTLNSVTGPGIGSYRAGQNLDFTANYNENVLVTGTPTIGLTIGVTPRNASYVSGSGSSALVFRYTVQAGETDSDGIASASPIVLNGGTIKDAATNNAGLAFAPPITTGVLVDTTAPTAAITYSPTGPVKAGASLLITATFSEPLADSPVVKLAISGANTLAASDMTKTDSTHYTYTHTVGAGNGTATVALSVGTDVAGNVVTSAPTSGATFTVDNTAPTAAITYSPTGPVKSGTSLLITATFSEPLTDSPVVRLAISGANTLAASDMTKTDSTHYTYTHTVGAGNGTATVALSVGTDVAGNVVTSAPTSGATFTVDNTVPDPPSQPDLSASDDKGASNSDNVTNVDHDLKFSGTAEPSSTVQLFNGSGSDTASAGGPGNWNITATGPFSEGPHTFRAKATDAAGNTSDFGPGLNVTIDLTNPTVDITPVSSGPSYPTPFTFNWAVSDPVSGGVSSGVNLSSCTLQIDVAAPVAVSCTSSDSSLTAGTHTVIVTGTDIAGNTGSATRTYTVVSDSTPPVIVCGAADGLWHPGDVTIHCTASDADSGLADPADASFDLSTNVAAGTETANASTGSHQVCDVATNCATAGPISGNMVDKKAPQLSTCDAADGAWHLGDVTLHCTYTDGGSGPASQQIALSTNVSVGTETANAIASANGTQACDAVNNCASSPADIAGNKVDKKAPAVSCASADSIWHANNQTVNCTSTDGGSGLADAGDGSFDLSTSVANGTETDNANTNSHEVFDAVGNHTTGGPVGPFKIDKKKPTITASATKADTSAYVAGTWTNQTVTVHFTCSDGGSGVASCPSDAVLSAEGVTPSVDGTATDNVGNSANASFGPVKIDKTDPTITGSRTPAANANGWNNTDVTVSFSCSDALSGIASCGPTPQVVSAEGAGQSRTGTAVDEAGNSASATVSDINIDKTVPTITITTPPDGTTYLLNQAVTAAFSCSDNLSGFLAGNPVNGPTSDCSGPSTVNTSTVGQNKTFTVNATDKAGNPATKTVHYNVQYNFIGFLPPIDNLPILNLVKAGQTVPTKWQLKDANGNLVSDLSSLAPNGLQSGLIACDTGAPLAPVEELSSPGSTVFRFDGTQFIYNWQTSKGWAGSCRLLQVTLADGTQHYAKFQLK